VSASSAMFAATPLIDGAMNRGERQQLRAVTDEVSGWVEMAIPVRALRSEAANAAVAARTHLLGSVVEVPRHGLLAWRVLPLRSTDRDQLQNLAR
jgi:hypothetical protein